MEDYLYLLSSTHNLKIHSFVLMANHFHLLISAPEGNLSNALLYFMRETSKQITRLSGRINQTYGNRNYKTRITRYHHFLNTYKYVYQNPAQAGVCTHVENYPFSTLNGLCGFSKLIIPVNDELLFQESFQIRELDWLNKAPDPENWAQMKAALRRSTFSLTAHPRTREKSYLETGLL